MHYKAKKGSTENPYEESTTNAAMKGMMKIIGKRVK